MVKPADHDPEVDDLIAEAIAAEGKGSKHGEREAAEAYRDIINRIRRDLPDLEPPAGWEKRTAARLRRYRRRGLAATAVVFAIGAAWIALATCGTRGTPPSPQAWCDRSPSACWCRIRGDDWERLIVDDGCNGSVDSTCSYDGPCEPTETP